MRSIQITGRNLGGVKEFLESIDLPANIARKMPSITTALSNAIDNLAESERSLVSSLGGTIGQDGNIDFTEAENTEQAVSEFVKQREDMLDNDKFIITESVAGSLDTLYAGFLSNWNGIVPKHLVAAYNELMDALEAE